MARLRDQYLKEIRPRVMERLGVTNVHAAPRLKKITVSMGIGAAKDNKKLLEVGVAILEKITGQKAIVTRAKTSIAQFRLRQGMAVGACVTVRGERMYELLDRLVNVVIPRIRDFRGMKRKLDGRGNYNMGLTEQSVFPEVSMDLLEWPMGMNVSMSIAARDDAEGTALLEEFGFPFRAAEEAAA